MESSPAALGTEFDRLATLAGARWDANRHYHGRVLRALPAGGERVLEVGCGAGELTRALARRAARVVALDLSPAMLARARANCAGLAVELVCADFLRAPLAPRSFDAVVSVATLHHLPMEAALARMGELLRPGGRLLVLDVYRDPSVVGRARALAAGVLASALRLAHDGRLRPPREVRAAWAAHARFDRLLTPREARERVLAVLPGARVRALLLWRYEIAWVRP